MIPTYSNDGGGMMVCGVFICWFDVLRTLVNVGYTYMYCYIVEIRLHCIVWFTLYNCNYMIGIVWLVLHDLYWMIATLQLDDYVVFWCVTRINCCITLKTWPLDWQWLYDYWWLYDYHG